MFSRCFSVVLLSFVFVAVSVFAVQSIPLLFAQEEAFGKLCYPGDYYYSEIVTTDPPVETNPVTYINTIKYKNEHTDAACIVSACVPLGFWCDDTKQSNYGLTTIAAYDENGKLITKKVLVKPQTMKGVDTQKFVLGENGKYREEYRKLGHPECEGYYMMCADETMSGYE